MAKELNKQQREYIAYRLENLDHIAAVKKAYPNLTKGSAYVIGCRLKKNPAVQEQLEKGEKEMRSVVINKQAKFIDILRELCPPLEVCKKLGELVFSNDSRVAMQAIDTYLKLSSEFPDAKIGLYRDLDRERSAVLTEAVLEKIKETKEPPLIEEAEIKE